MLVCTCARLQPTRLPWQLRSNYSYAVTTVCTAVQNSGQTTFHDMNQLISHYKGISACLHTSMLVGLCSCVHVPGSSLLGFLHAHSYHSSATACTAVYRTIVKLYGRNNSVQNSPWQLRSNYSNAVTTVYTAVQNSGQTTFHDMKQFISEVSFVHIAYIRCRPTMSLLLSYCALVCHAGNFLI
jgi:predicted metal-dependent peptidase